MVDKPKSKTGKLTNQAKTVGYKMTVGLVGIMVMFSLAMSGFVPQDMQPVEPAEAATWDQTALEVTYDASANGYDVSFDDQNASFTSGEQVTLQFEDPNSTNIDMSGATWTVGFSDGSFTVSNVSSTVVDNQTVQVSFTVDQAVSGAYMYVQTTSAGVDVTGSGTLGVGDTATGTELAGYNYDQQQDGYISGQITTDESLTNGDSLTNNVTVNLTKAGNETVLQTKTVSTYNGTYNFSVDPANNYDVVIDGGNWYNSPHYGNLSVSLGATTTQDINLSSKTTYNPINSVTFNDTNPNNISTVEIEAVDESGTVINTDVVDVSNVSTYSFGAFSGINATVTVDANGYAANSFTYQTGTTTAQDVNLDAVSTYTVDGQLTHYDDNVSVDNRNIELVQDGTVIKTVTTDADGNYSFSVVEDGNYTVQSEIDNETTSLNITVNGSNVTANLNYVESSGGGLIGGNIVNDIVNWAQGLVDKVTQPFKDTINGVKDTVDAFIKDIQDIVNYTPA